jgi:hypothetical protein
MTFACYRISHVGIFEINFFFQNTFFKESVWLNFEAAMNEFKIQSVL